MHIIFISSNNWLLHIQGTGKAIVIGVGAELTLPLGLFAILLGRTLKGSVFGGLKARSDLSIVANKGHKKVILESFYYDGYTVSFFLHIFVSL